MQLKLDRMQRVPPSCKSLDFPEGCFGPDLVEGPEDGGGSENPEDGDDKKGSEAAAMGGGFVLLIVILVVCVAAVLYWKFDRISDMAGLPRRQSAVKPASASGP